MRTRMPPLCVGVWLFTIIACATAVASQGVDLGSAAPGQAVTIPLDALRRTQNDGVTRVTIGGRDAAIALAERGRVIVYVPVLPPGEVPVRVYAGNTLVASNRIEIVASPRRSFLFARSGEQIELLRVRPTSSEASRNVRSLEPRLSFDLVDSTGTLLYSTSVVDPSEASAESFTRSEEGSAVSLGQARVEHRSVFPVQLPAMPAATELRVYRAPAGLDIFTPEGRAQRILLRRFPLEKEGAR